jgi:hypothetical protein
MPKKTGRQEDKKTRRQEDKKTGRQEDRKTGRQEDGFLDMAGYSPGLLRSNGCFRFR